MKIQSIRVTALDLYDMCPYCFYLSACGVRQVSNEKMALGSSVHKAIENYHHGILQPDLKTAPFLATYTPKYHAEKDDLVEYRFSLSIPKTKIVLTGTIDLIQNGWIFEHKTSKARYTPEMVHNNTQVTAYSWAYRQIFQKPERGIRFNIFVKNKEIKLQTLDTFRVDADYVAWLDHVYEILAGIEANHFDPAPGRFHNYKSCPMVNL